MLVLGGGVTGEVGAGRNAVGGVVCEPECRRAPCAGAAGVAARRRDSEGHEAATSACVRESPGVARQGGQAAAFLVERRPAAGREDEARGQEIAVAVHHKDAALAMLRGWPPPRQARMQALAGVRPGPTTAIGVVGHRRSQSWEEVAIGRLRQFFLPIFLTSYLASSSVVL